MLFVDFLIDFKEEGKKSEVFLWQFEGERKMLYFPAFALGLVLCQIGLIVSLSAAENVSDLPCKFESLRVACLIKKLCGQR